MKNCGYFIAFLLVQLSGYTQSVEIKSYVDKNTVGVNETFTFTVSTNSNCQIYTPEFGDLIILQGPFRSSSSKILDINGKRSMQQELTYTYRLRAPKEGSYAIRGVRMVCSGKEHNSKPINIKVVKSASSSGDSQSYSVPRGSSDFFIRMYANKTTVFQGEPFALSLKIFSKRQPQNIENLEIGDSKGLIRKDLNPNQSTFNSDVEVINGIRYYTTTIRTELCFAQNSGDIKIDPAHITAIFRRNVFQHERKEANSNSLSIKVNPLPSGAPKNFNGLVGSIKLNHSLSKNVLKPGEAIDLQVEISGSGNLNTFDDPKFAFPNDFEQFDPEIDNKLSYKSSGISGKIVYNYVLIPTFYGKYTIPAYDFSYFDIETKKYKTLSTGDINIEVLKTANSEAGNTNIGNDQKAVEIEKTDIHHIVTLDKLNGRNGYFAVSKIWYYFLLAFTPLSFGFILWRRKQNQSETYIKNSTLKTSYKNCVNCIQDAKSLASNHDNQGAIKTISHALKTFLKQNDGFTNADLNLSSLTEHYVQKGWSESEILTLKIVWNNLEMYHYAPITADKLDDLILDTEHLIERIKLDK